MKRIIQNSPEIFKLEFDRNSYGLELDILNFSNNVNRLICEFHLILCLTFQLKYYLKSQLQNAFISVVVKILNRRKVHVDIYSCI